MIKIAPSILSAHFECLEKDILDVQKAGADYLHIDVMDGHFVPNITIGPLIVEALRPISNLIFDVHLMIENPDLFIKQFVDAGADIICVHVEACTHIHRTIQYIKSLGARAAVALNPGTPINCLDYIIEELDMILIMTVNPGFGGQAFIPSTLSKISHLKKMIIDRNLNIDIEVDGGIKLGNLSEVICAGANVIVAGSAIFLSEDINKAVAAFKKAGTDINTAGNNL
jgi:ribulose-phosphate 3-epimerase